MIAGSTRDEMRSLILARLGDGLGPVTPEQYPQVVGEFYGSDADAVLAEYPHARYESPDVALATVLTDEGRVHGSCRQVVSDEAAGARAPVYAYEFAEPTGDTTDGFPHGARHGADIPYFFDSYVREPVPMTEAQHRLADTLIGHWTTFARTGDPGGDWTPSRPGSGAVLLGGRVRPGGRRSDPPMRVLVATVNPASPAQPLGVVPTERPAALR